MSTHDIGITTLNIIAMQIFNSLPYIFNIRTDSSTSKCTLTLDICVRREGKTIDKFHILSPVLKTGISTIVTNITSISIRNFRNVSVVLYLFTDILTENANIHFTVVKLLLCHRGFRCTDFIIIQIPCSFENFLTQMFSDVIKPATAGKYKGITKFNIIQFCVKRFSHSLNENIVPIEELFNKAEIVFEKMHIYNQLTITLFQESINLSD